MTRALVYIAGPYGNLNDIIRRENIRKVAWLSRYAIWKGFAPVSVHAGIESGAYGDDENPAERAIGLECACHIALTVARANGRMWMIANDGGGLSSGTQEEFNHVDAELNASGFDPDPIFTRHTWSGWLEQMTAEGYLP